MPSHATDVRWPTRYDYDIAIENLSQNLLDTELSSGRLASTKSGIIQYATTCSVNCLYRVDNWMVRCFCRFENREPDENITERYQRLGVFFRDNQTRVSALIPLNFLEKGIKVDFFERDEFNSPVR